MIELFVGVVSYVKIVVDVIHIFYAPKKKVFMNIIVFEYKQRERESESERERVTILPPCNAYFHARYRVKKI
jgi:hypothetical protein